MRRIRPLLGVIVAAACASAVAPAVAQAAPTAPYTALVVHGSDQDSFLDFHTGVWDSGNAIVTPTLHYGDAFQLSADPTAEEGTSEIKVYVQPPAGQTWQQGRTYAAAPDFSGEQARLDVSDRGGSCLADGTLTVREVVRDPATGKLTTFAASFDYTCRGRSGTIDGEIRWNSSVDYNAAVASGPLDFGQVEVAGDEVGRTETFTSQGIRPVTFGTASLGGHDPAPYRITADTCSGRTLPPGETCTVTVTAGSTRVGGQTASLVLPDDSSFGRRSVRLYAEGFRGAVGTYYPLATPQRLMDTRTGLGGRTGPIGQGGTVDLQVAGRGGVPAAGAGAVVLNVTVTGPTASSFLTVYPADVSRPNASSINFPAGWLGSNNVTVKVGANGNVKIYNRNGSTHVVVDVAGFYAGSNAVQPTRGIGSQYQPVPPGRLFDTRTGGGPIPARGVEEGFVDFGEELSWRVQGLVLNVTAVAPAKSGFLTVWSGEGSVPTSSTVNYGAGKVVPNLAVVRTKWCTDCGPDYPVPSFAVFTSQNANVVVDLVGVMDDGNAPDGLRFTPVAPTRIVDSRTGLGTSGALGPKVTRTVTVTTPPELVGEATRALATNVTAVSPTQPTVITVWPAGQAKPTASNLNPAAGQIVSNAVFTGLDPSAAFNVHNHAGSTHLVTDVVGSFWLYPATASEPTGSLAATPRFAIAGSGTR
ncbi:hypothetical protein M2302_003655 [Micromonospora sp. A200]|uniref:hypothetical protein n=1 Tax=Micromonospora sp. A200 TaxID=2940568 RepID=UPI0024737BEF|nr:hypothetical protein [Micromonospora sp. A200]MDH6463463.1 hypothetical protein [Micromonospora sp. A200]